MNIERIKKELALRVEQLVEGRKGTAVSEPVGQQVHKSWSDKIAETEDLVHRVYHTLYEVLQQQGIYFRNDLEMEGFVSILEPTVHDLVIKNIEA